MSTSALQQDYISQSDKYHPFDDVARDHLQKKIKLTEYRDIDLKFNKNPNTNNLVVRKGDEAVKQAIKNIILTNFGERIMRPNVGSGIQALLFEPANQITEIRIKELIIETITNHEKRATVENVSVKSTHDGLGYEITIVFSILGSEKPVKFVSFLKANRG